MSNGLSGTCGHGPSGTAYPDYRVPDAIATRRISAPSGFSNNANPESFGFLLTATALCTNSPGAPVYTPRHAAARTPRQTHVTLVWRDGRHEDWIRFGRPVAQRIIDRRRRVESYAPGQVFALVRWAANDFGTSRSAVYVVRALEAGDAYTPVPQVDPGGELLLALRGWPKVRRFFDHVDALEQAGFDPCDVSPDHWRHAGNRISVNMPPRTYSTERHRAWLSGRVMRP